MAQEKIDDVKSINGLELASTLESLESELQLITGTESIYQNNPWLAASVKRNFDVGIQEGIYQGFPLRIVNGKEAHDLRLTYLSGSLYKCRWTYNKRDIPNMESGVKDFITYFIKKFGPPAETFSNETFIWKGDVNRLTINYYNGTVQIEWRDNISDNRAKQLTEG
ncbi:hypothetical protein [Algoriphagus sp. Y33]|uniref:hypothetical protein n=1 Tax=Algoriphagus sp. Y33 TaxID=2772483 RepID=UPI001CE1C0CB|nr:hypothetical protein [Algoriphagus sp. Y33]